MIAAKAIVLLGVVGMVVGCGGPLADAPSEVQALLQPYSRDGFQCVGPSTDNSAFEQWVCSKTDGSEAGYQIVVDENAASGLKQVVALIDQSSVGKVDSLLITQFFRRVAAGVIGANEPAFGTWLENASMGGQKQFANYLITVDVYGRVTHLSLFRQE